MKTKLALTLLVLFNLAVSAQQAFNGTYTLFPTGPVANCVGDANGDTLCAGDDAFYVSIKNGPFAKVVTGNVAAPVTSVFGRKGDVTPGTGDYQFGQIGGRLAAAQEPAAQTCDFTASVQPAGNKITLSACQ